MSNLDLNPDVDDDIRWAVIAYSYPCTFCGAKVGESCTLSSAFGRQSVRFPHSTRGTDYVSKAARRHFERRTSELFAIAVEKVIAKMEAEKSGPWYKQAALAEEPIEF